MCHAAGDYREALRLFQSDPGITVVILDYEMPDAYQPYIDIQTLTETFRSVRKGVCIIGTSGVDRTANFERVGVKLFLKKPWRMDELIKLLQREVQ